MKDGIIKGKHAYNYDKYSFSLKKKKQHNSFLNRNVIKGKIIVDFCCGTGVSIEFLKSRAKKIYGIDASHEMIKICKERFKKDNNVILLQENVNSTSIKNESCDYVLIRMGLHHIKDKKKVLNEAYRILKNNGKLLIMDKFSNYPKYITLIYDMLRNLKRGYGIFGHYYIKLFELKNMIKNKFKILDEFSHKKQIYIKANLVLEKV
jgi:ubiquinone/menaquinone biosynthesis C-methylase UbiE